MSRSSETSLGRFTRRINELKKATKSGEITANQYARSVRDVKRMLDQERLSMTRNIVETNRKAMADRLAAKAARNRRLAGGAARFGGRVAFAGATAFAAGAIQTARVSEGFNQAMNSSLAIMKDVNAEMREDMKRTAFEIASVTKFSGKEAAESYFFLASAGLDAKQSLAALPVVAQFAQAGMFDMALATDLLTDAQSALGKTVKDPIKNLKNMTKLGDQLVKANTLANASVQQFSEALTNKAAAAMRILNIETSEGIAVLAAFADQGLKGAEAGTAFSIVLRDLTSKAIKQRNEFDALGVTVFDSAGKFQGMSNIVGDLEVALFGLSDEQKKATLLQLGFSDKSVQFTQILLGMSEKIREYERGIDEAGGTMKRVADNQLTPFAKGFEAVKAAFAEFSVDAATGPMADLGKAMEDLAKPGGDLITMLNGIVDAIDDMNTGILEALLAWEQFKASQVDVANTLAELGPARDLPSEAPFKEFLESLNKEQSPRRISIAISDTTSETMIQALQDQIRERERATKERLDLRARGGKDLPETREQRIAKLTETSQKQSIEFWRKWYQERRKLDAQAANQQRAKDMELLKATEKAADKIREAFSSPLQDFLDKLKELESIRGKKGGLTEEEFQRASGMARKDAIRGIQGQRDVAQDEQRRQLRNAGLLEQADVTAGEAIRRDIASPVDIMIEEFNARLRHIGAVRATGGITEAERQAAILFEKEKAVGQVLSQDISDDRKARLIESLELNPQELAEIRAKQLAGEKPTEPLSTTAGKILEKGTDAAFAAILQQGRGETKTDTAIIDTAIATAQTAIEVEKIANRDPAEVGIGDA